MLQMVSGEGVPCDGGWSVCVCVCGGGGGRRGRRSGVYNDIMTCFLQWYVPEKSKE